jgi:sterol desaturase/sphingolipid hydroxylase (fatty acid hydroxylase superfamily)
MDQWVDRIYSLAGQAMQDLSTPFISPAERTFLPYIVLSFLPLIWITCREQKSLHPRHWWEACFPRKLWAHPSSKADLGYVVSYLIIFTAMAAPFTFISVAMTDATYNGLTALFGKSHLMHINIALALLFTLVVVLLADLGLYWAHYLQHKIPLLWEFHKVHHSAEVLTPVTVYRMHPVDNLLNFFLTSTLVGLGNGVFFFLFIEEPHGVTLFGLNVIQLLFFIFFYNLRHSHVWMHYPDPLPDLLISPAQHQIHHSSLERHWDKNFGFMFSIWDRLFGTLYLPKGKEELILGIGPESSEYHSVTALYILPFRKSARLLRRFWQDRRHETPLPAPVPVDSASRKRG